MICCIFLSVDIYIQHIFGKDLFGYPVIEERYNGVFHDEAIAGSYIQKFSMLSILAIFFFKISNNLKKILLILTSNILAIGTLLTLDRMPFIMIVFGFVLLIFYIKKLRFTLFLNIIIIAILFTFLFNSYKPINKRYFDLKKEINISKIINFISNKDENNNSDSNLQNYEKTNYTIKEPILIGGYGKIFESTLYIYKYDWLIGSGTKSFQNKCYKLSEIKEDLSCPPHPHNIYLEILINMGLVGLIIFLIFVINLIVNLLQTDSLKNKTNKIVSNLFIIILICELIPLRSYGSIFQTVNGSIFWFLLSIIGSFTFINKNLIK
jgi:O-antigen ligase